MVVAAECRLEHKRCPLKSSQLHRSTSLSSTPQHFRFHNSALSSTPLNTLGASCTEALWTVEVAQKHLEAPHKHIRWLLCKRPHMRNLGGEFVDWIIITHLLSVKNHHCSSPKTQYRHCFTSYLSGRYCYSKDSNCSNVSASKVIMFPFSKNLITTSLATAWSSFEWTVEQWTLAQWNIGHHWTSLEWTLVECTVEHLTLAQWNIGQCEVLNSWEVALLASRWEPHNLSGKSRCLYKWAKTQNTKQTSQFEGEKLLSKEVQLSQLQPQNSSLPASGCKFNYRQVPILLFGGTERESSAGLSPSRRNLS